MQYKIINSFNSQIPSVMHVDINSCFASVEQQYNPKYQNKPLVVTPNSQDYGCIIAVSKEAKLFGIKTGQKIHTAKQLCKQIIIVNPDVKKYQIVHLKLKKILQKYCPTVIPKSIDEFSCVFTDMYPIYSLQKMTQIANNIKLDIKKDIGKYVTVSIGISTNMFLAKTASDIYKPDGLFIIDKDNFFEVYNHLSLTDLCGISSKNEIRLNSLGIFTIIDFYNTKYQDLKCKFKTVNAYLWYMRLRGWEVDDTKTKRGSYSNSYILRESISNLNALKPILNKIICKLADRIRADEYTAKGLIIKISYYNNKAILKKYHSKTALFESTEIYKILINLIKPSYINDIKVKQIYVGAFDLNKYQYMQLDLFMDTQKQINLCSAIDNINKKWGNKTITPSIHIDAKKSIPDSIPFGQHTFK